MSSTRQKKKALARILCILLLVATLLSSILIIPVALRSSSWVLVDDEPSTQQPLTTLSPPNQDISDDKDYIRRLSIFGVPSQLRDPKSVADKFHVGNGQIYNDSDADIKQETKIYTYTDLINNATPLPRYSLSNVITAERIYTSRFSLLRYDPKTDRFIGYYSERHKWVSGCTKLAEAIRILTILLRNLFPDRFTPDSPELVLAVSGGDYPAVDTRFYGACIHKDEASPCDDSLLEQAPILHFGSVFRNALFPNMIAFPMPRAHTDCFANWLMRDREPCQLFLPTSADVTWDELIPQLVWRGTDFRFLSIQNGLERPTFAKYIRGQTKPNSNQKKAATSILRQNFHKLLPRWKGLVLSAESEIEAARSNTLPKVNIKFTTAAEGGKHPAKGAIEYKEWEEIGFLVAGDAMDEEQLSKFKYHIDIGGGGGTTWTGTVRKLGMPGLLFHHITPTKDYIHDQIIPWIHYVPVRSDLEDLMEKLEWAETHQDEARRISENATELMKRLSTSEGFEHLFAQHILNPLLEVIEAYSPMNLSDEKSWNDTFEQLGGGVFLPFIECTNYKGCSISKPVPVSSWYKGS